MRNTKAGIDVCMLTGAVILCAATASGQATDAPAVNGASTALAVAFFTPGGNGTV